MNDGIQLETALKIVNDSLITTSASEALQLLLLLL